VDAGALLDDVHGFVRGGMQVWGVSEDDAIAERERARTELTGSLGRRSTDVSAYLRDVMTPKARLDLIEEWQRRALAFDGRRRDGCRAARVVEFTAHALDFAGLLACSLARAGCTRST